MIMHTNRRRLLKGIGASAFALTAPRLAQADKTLVAATFPGTWSEADRQIIQPAFKQLTGASVTQSIVLGHRPGVAAGGGQGQQAAVRRGLLRRAASARRRPRRA